MFELNYTRQFKKDLKHYKYDVEILKELEEILSLLASGKNLSEKYHNHPLIGEFKECYECHIRPDVLLVYKVNEHKITILLLRIGSHSNIFG
ncbi:MAG: type II toxin-antitoxin system YafQ family toxin [Candidatus Pacebacteria bacterium]|nr:type II toxin-antitoxin system YafQ family toxin [Candidatus Paceibacterota bacterium]